jgi:hypothetical protein
VLKKYSQVFLSIFFLTDMAVVSGAWLLAYHVRFHSTLFARLVPVYETTPRLDAYLMILPAILVVWAILLRRGGLYRARRANP